LLSNQDYIRRAVYLLWHTDKHGDEKLIGVYETDEGASSAISRVKDKPGFSDLDGKFEIAKYELNEDHWTEGFARHEGSSVPRWFRPTDSKE